MKDEQLETVLERHDPEDLRLVPLDGFTIYHTESDVKLWEWDAEFDGEPYQAIETLFAEVGLETES